MYDEYITVTFHPQTASVLNRLNSDHAVVTLQIKTVSASFNIVVCGAILYTP